jgi:hypothetical protein
MFHKLQHSHKFDELLRWATEPNRVFTFDVDQDGFFESVKEIPFGQTSIGMAWFRSTSYDRMMNLIEMQQLHTALNLFVDFCSTQLRSVRTQYLDYVENSGGIDVFLDKITRRNMKVAHFKRNLFRN